MNIKKIYHDIRRKIFIDAGNRRYQARKLEVEREFDSIKNKTETTTLPIVVSMTSYPARFHSLEATIKSIVIQTIRPSKIVLYLDDSVANNDVPQNIRSLEQYGLEIRFRPYDMKPHKKYHFAIQEFPDCDVITVDDDVLYPNDLIETLYETHKKFPGCVVAARGHKMRFDDEGSLMSYNEWEWETKDILHPSLSIIATGVGGVLYPVRCNYHEDTFKVDLLLQLSQNNDDIWLRVMETLVKTKVVLTDRHLIENEYVAMETQGASLQRSNVHQNSNDQFMHNLVNYYHLTKAMFEED